MQTHSRGSPFGPVTMATWLVQSFFGWPSRAMTGPASNMLNRNSPTMIHMNCFTPTTSLVQRPKHLHILVDADRRPSDSTCNIQGGTLMANSIPDLPSQTFASG